MLQREQVERGGGIDMLRPAVLFLCALSTGSLLLACGASPPDEKMALEHCQTLARDEMPDVAGNPRYRKHKTEIEQVHSGPEEFEFTVKGEYFFKAFDSGDSELRFTCTIAKSIEDEQWTTVEFDSVCVGGCV